MRYRPWFVQALLVWGLLGPRGVAALETAGTTASGPSPVVLELFTSQGCSSCPRADEVLSRLGLDERTRALVVPLAFHVDYWNRIGWADPFSASAWSLRQADYCRALGVDGGPYTPQIVVNGQAEFNGTQVQGVLSGIDAARERPSLARVSLAARPADGGRPALVVVVAAEIVASFRARRLELLVALFENGLVTPVARGENGGRILRNDFIVRRLETAFSIEPQAGARKQRDFSLKLGRGWKAENLGVAVFLQDTTSMRIYAAAALPRVVSSFSR